MIILSDLDGTAVLTKFSRIRLLQHNDYDAFNAGIKEDRPNKVVRQLLQSFYQRGHQIHFLAGRGEQTREATETWLWDWNFPFQRLLLRQPGDDRPDVLVKWDMIKQYNKGQVFCAFEDHTRTVKLYRRLGFLTFQVQQSDTIDQQHRAFRHTLTRHKAQLLTDG